jgi:LEA14-like dessication related protein
MINNEISSHVMSLKETVRSKGVPVTVDAVRANGQTFLVSGNLLKTAELKEFWAEDLENPEDTTRKLKEGPVRVDILKFWQRIPDSEPKYPYYREIQHVAAIPITTHKHWFEKQIIPNARNKIRKAAKLGVEIREEDLSDELIRGIMGIYNDSPLRRGKPFWHYGKDFDTVKRELSDNPHRCTYVTAYCEGELIGFIKLFFLDRYARTTLILDKVSRREKSPMNSLVSKVIEICAEKGISYFVYSIWRRGDHGHFQGSNGFIKTPVPQYFVPLTTRGKLALLLRLHHGIRAWIPERMMIPLLDLRAKWLARKFRTKAFRFVHQ